LAARGGRNRENVVLVALGPETAKKCTTLAGFHRTGDPMKHEEYEADEP
jgi:hypothetical protein